MKKIIALCLSLLLVFSTISFVSAGGAPTIEVSSATAAPGEQVTLQVSLNGNPGINTFSLGFDYDTEKLQLDGVALSSGIPGQFTYVQKAVWLNSADITTNGAYLDLTFTVLETAEEGDADVTVTYSEGDICNYDEADVNFDIVAGKVTVAEKTVEPTDPPVIPDTAPKYSIYADKNGIAGKTVTVYVAIENNPGIVSLRNSVSYDQSVFTLETVTNLEKLGGFVTPAPNKKSPYTLMWEDATAQEDNTANGDIVALTFTVSEDAAAGEYDISVAHIESYNQKLEKVEFADASSVITVIDVQKGDVNADGSINGADSILLARYLAKWDVEVIDFACDIDEDGEITDRDSIIFKRYLAGWYASLDPSEWN